MHVTWNETWAENPIQSEIRLWIKIRDLEMSYLRRFFFFFGHNVSNNERRKTKVITISKRLNSKSYD